MTAGRHVVFVVDVYAAAGMRRTDVTALKRPMLRALGLFNRNVVTSTVDWYRAHTTTPELSTGLTEAMTLKVTS